MICPKEKTFFFFIKYGDFSDQSVSGQNVYLRVKNIVQKFFYRRIGRIIYKHTVVAFQHSDNGIKILINDLAILFDSRISLLRSVMLNLINFENRIVHFMKNFRSSRRKHFRGFMVEVAQKLYKAL